MSNPSLSSLPLSVHPIRYPTVSAYLHQLPAGLASFPGLCSVSELPMVTRRRWPELHRQPDLPRELQEALGQSWPPGSWVPEVLFMLQNALVRDVIFRNDEGYLNHNYEVVQEALSGLAMRAILLLASPKLAILSVKKKWGSVKKGSELTSLQGGPKDHELSLHHPAGAYLPCMLAGFGRSFLAALNSVGAKDAKVTAKIISKEECRFSLSWG